MIAFHVRGRHLRSADASVWTGGVRVQVRAAAAPGEGGRGLALAVRARWRLPARTVPPTLPPGDAGEAREGGRTVPAPLPPTLLEGGEDR